MFNFYSIENGKLKRDIIVEKVISGLWTPKYNTMGTFSLEMPYTSELAQAIKPNMYLSYNGSTSLMYVQSIEKTKLSINVTGTQASQILRERAVTELINGGNVENALHGYVNSLGFEYLTNGDKMGYTDDSNIQVGNSTFLVLAQELTQAVDMGFEVYKDNKDVKFRCYKPVENPNFKFNTNIGNLLDESATVSSINYYDSVVVQGNGFVVRGGNQNLDRKELYFDQTTQSQQEGETLEAFKTRLLNWGLMQLGRYTMIEQYKFTPKLIPVENLTKTGEVVPTLGDIVNVSMIDFGVAVKARIIGFQTKIQGNVISEVAEVGTPIIK